MNFSSNFYQGAIEGYEREVAAAQSAGIEIAFNRLDQFKSMLADLKELESLLVDRLRTMSKKVQRTERGWGGHFICAHRCLFRRNTLLEYQDLQIVVSTVGLMQATDRSMSSDAFTDEISFKEIGHHRYYETMAFHVDPADTRYHDSNVSRKVNFASPWSIDRLDADDEANAMHEAVVQEIATRLLNGESFKENHE